MEAVCEAGHRAFESLRDDYPEMFTDLEGKPLAPGDYSGAAKALCGLLEWARMERDQARKHSEYWRAKWYETQLAGIGSASLEAQLDNALKKV